MPLLVNWMNSLKNIVKKGFEHQIDIYSDAKIEPENDELNCRFKDTCYGLKSKQRKYPCELNE